MCVLARGRIIERGSPAEVTTHQRSVTLEDAHPPLLASPDRSSGW